jgi:hypothetical protein
MPKQLYEQPTQIAKTVWFNLDNGAGTTIDDVILLSTLPVQLLSAKAVYVDATTGTVAAGNFRVGTTVGGSDVVASTAYENTKTVGTSTAGTLLVTRLTAGQFLAVRHTGVAATQAGQAFVQIEYAVEE